jgi:hypothetical protein
MGWNAFSSEPPSPEEIEVETTEVAEARAWSAFASAPEPEEGEDLGNDPVEASTDKEITEEAEDSDTKPEPEGDASENKEAEKATDGNDESLDESSGKSRLRSPNQDDSDQLEPREGDKPFMAELRADAKQWRSLTKDNPDVIPIAADSLALGKAWMTGDVDKIFEIADELGKQTSMKIISTVLEAEAENHVAEKYKLASIEDLHARLTTSTDVKLSDDEELAVGLLPDDIQDAVRAKLSNAATLAQTLEAERKARAEIEQSFAGYQEAVFTNAFQNEFESFWNAEFNGVAEELAKGVDVTEQSNSIRNAARAEFFKSKDAEKAFTKYENALRMSEGKRAIEFAQRELRRTIGDMLRQEFKTRKITPAQEPKPEKRKQESPPVVEGKRSASPSTSKPTPTPFWELPPREQERLLREGVEARKKAMRR